MVKCSYISRKKNEVRGRQMKGDDMEASMRWQNGVLDNMTRG